MKSILTTLLILLATPALAQTLPLRNIKGQVDTKVWFISHGWAGGDHVACEFRMEALSWKPGDVLSMAVMSKEEVLRQKPGTKFNTDRKHICSTLKTRGVYKYGVYSVRMKAAKGSGLVSSFYTYVGPGDGGKIWDEIDFEILGKDTSKVELNYWVNGKSQGTPKYDLGFDSSADFHTYSFIWSPNFIRWYVDGKLLREVKATASKPMPAQPGKVHLSVWAGQGSGMRGWLGPFVYQPTAMEVMAVCTSDLTSPGCKKPNGQLLLLENQ